MDDIGEARNNGRRAEKLFEAFRYVAATYGTCTIVFEPFVDTFGVEYVIAGKSANILALFEVRLTNDAHRLLVRLRPTESVARQLIDF